MEKLYVGRGYGQFRGIDGRTIDDQEKDVVPLFQQYIQQASEAFIDGSCPVPVSTVV